MIAHFFINQRPACFKNPLFFLPLNKSALRKCTVGALWSKKSSFFFLLKIVFIAYEKLNLWKNIAPRNLSLFFSKNDSEKRT